MWTAKRLRVDFDLLLCHTIGYSAAPSHRFYAVTKVLNLVVNNRGADHIRLKSVNNVNNAKVNVITKSIMKKKAKQYVHIFCNVIISPSEK